MTNISKWNVSKLQKMNSKNRKGAWKGLNILRIKFEIKGSDKSWRYWEIKGRIAMFNRQASFWNFIRLTFKI